MPAYSLKEDNIIQANDAFIKQACKKYGRGLPWDDCIMAAHEGFLCAMRTYRKGYHQFHPYAEICLRQYLEQERKRYNLQKRIESNFSMDQPIINEGRAEAAGNIFFSVHDHVADVIFKDYIERLPPEHQITAKLYALGYTAKEVLSISGIPLDRQAEIRECLKNCYDL